MARNRLPRLARPVPGMGSKAAVYKLTANVGKLLREVRTQIAASPRPAPCLLTEELERSVAKATRSVRVKVGVPTVETTARTHRRLGAFARPKGADARKGAARVRGPTAALVLTASQALATPESRIRLPIRPEVARTRRRQVGVVT